MYNYFFRLLRLGIGRDEGRVPNDGGCRPLEAQIDVSLDKVSGEILRRKRLNSLQG